jgi:hypothetical protein
MTRRPNFWQRVLALAPLLLVIASLPTQVLVRCRMDGQVRASCCCPAEKNESATPALKAAECCDREVSVRSVPTVRTAPEVSSVPTAVATLIPYPDLPATGPGAPRIFRESPPARGGPPLLLLKQTFLI